MNKVFFPGCRIKEGYPDSSKKLQDYIKKKMNINPVGCCKVDYEKLDEQSCAILICNNCANDLNTISTNRRREFVWKIIDEDTSFDYPNHSGKKVLIQDCNHGYNDEGIKIQVRSLLKKMNIQYEEMDNKDAIPYGLSREEHRKKVAENAYTYPQEEVLTYCAICNLAMNKNGKNSTYLLDLLFKEEE